MQGYKRTQFKALSYIGMKNTLKRVYEKEGKYYIKFGSYMLPVLERELIRK